MNKLHELFGENYAIPPPPVLICYNGRDRIVIQIFFPLRKLNIILEIITSVTDFLGGFSVLPNSLAIANS